MPPDIEEHARKELKRLERMNEASGEYSMARTYLDTLLAMPWSKLDVEDIDIERARGILDADHYGLEKVKKRIVEYLAVRKLNPQGRSPILCFVGPPGVGKTSLGQSIARALGIKFQRVSLGGTHDEAEIRGHRRTYIGALPGNIMQAIRKAGTRNPVLMLDEIDKLGVGIQGDPASALLEVLDPEQNSTFRDNYLGVPFDLSKVLFIATANVLDTIPGPLRDRMEIIELTGLHRGGEGRDRATLPGASGSSRRTASSPSRLESPTRRCSRSRATTRARRACARSSGRSARCCATSRCGSPKARRPPSRSTRKKWWRSSARRASKTRSRCG